MDYKFIYVFDTKSKQELLAAGFDILIDNDKKSIFVFKANANLSFAVKDLEYVPSNTLTFS